MKLIVGLGNPGEEYAWTRHNAGWLTIDSFVNRLALREPQMKFRGAFWGPVFIEGERVSLLKPYTYMNLSGMSVLEAVRYQNVEPQDVLVIFDDVALPFGRVRMREKGSAGGQNGMKSIIGALGTFEIPRLRIGMGSPDGRMDMKDWVLGRIPSRQKDGWNDIENMAWDAVNIWLRDGIQKAMSAVNGQKKEEEDKKA